MKKTILWLFLALSLVSLGACVNRNASGNSNTLARGFNQTEVTKTAPSEMATVIKATPGVVAIYDGQALPVSEDMSVPSYAILRSNEKGSAELVFANGTKVNISSNSEIALSDVAPVAKSQPSQGGRFANKLSGLFGQSQERDSTQATVGVRGIK